jgi:aldehyde dehydrogenase (NAD+)
MKVQNSSFEKIEEIISLQRNFFKSEKTKKLDFRKKMLKRLLSVMKQWESDLSQALYKDLHKSYEEAYMTEFSIVYGEIKQHLNHFKDWADRESVSSPLKMFPSRSYLVKEPLGNTLIISPWNYPVQLLLNPLVGAISSGCTAVLKPSPYTPNVSNVLAKMISENFDEEYIAVVQGNREVNERLLSYRFDLIFFTGSPLLGKLVMKAASQYLTPVILELGGKSPCIVDKSCDVKLAARRIVFGKTLNSGQTCIAPDYLFIHKNVKAEFIEAFQDELKQMHGVDPEKSEHYVRIVNEKAFDRVLSYMEEGDVIVGGKSNRETRYIEPTLIENVKCDSSLMTDEIFGPIFPLMEFEDIDEVLKFVNEREKPLALYYFGDEKKGWKVIRKTSSGGACINDTIMHIANENAPFGGVGNSGMGSYHGRDSFLAFSHRRTVVATPKSFDLPLRYMPYKFFKWIKKLL